MKTFQRPKHIEIIYFTGTGGTRMAAEECEANLVKSGVTVRLYEIDKKKEYVHRPADLFLFLYPVYAFNAPRPMYELVDTLPLGNGSLAAVISVSGGGEVTPNLACRLHLIERLQKKDYNVVYENMIVMPANCISSIPEDLSIRLLQILPKKICFMMEELLSGVYRRTKPDLLNRLIAALGELEKTKSGEGLFGRSIRACDSCNGCGLCSHSCPMANITMVNSRPVYGNNCTLCLRCIYGCPKKALKPALGSFFPFKSGYNLNIIKTKILNKNLAPIEDMTKGFSMIGVRKYFKKPRN